MITTLTKNIQTTWDKIRQIILKYNFSYFKKKTINIINLFKSESNVLVIKLKNLKQTNYDLGLFHYSRGALSDAIFRFKIVNRFWPDISVVPYYIGRCYVEILKFDKAKTYIGKYLESGDTKFREEAKFCYDIINNRLSLIKQIPLGLIEHYFDIIAPAYNELYMDDKANIPQQQLINMLNTALTEIGKPFGNLFLDIGCGTGIAGKFIREAKSARSIEGIDLSSGMVDEANKQTFENMPVYNKITKTDFDSFANKCDVLYDAIVTSRFLDYYPDLAKFLQFCARHLKKGGIIGIALKVTQTISQYEIIPQLEEFAFNLESTRKAFKDAGFDVKNEIEVTFPDGYKGCCFILLKE